jgi:hypothetical protein
MFQVVQMVMEKIKKQKGVLSVEEIKKLLKKLHNAERKKMVERSRKKHANQK